MNYLQLIVCVILCTSYTCQAMKIIKKKKKEEIIHTTSKVSFSDTILVSKDFLERAKPDHPHKQDLITHFIIKGIEWNELELIKKGIILGGNINYANPTKDNLNFIQIACKEKSCDIVAELLKSPDINIYAYKQNTLPAFHLAAKRGDKKIINLLIKHDPKIVTSLDRTNKEALFNFLIIKYLPSAFLLDQTDHSNIPFPKEIRFLIARLYYTLQIQD